MKKLLLLLFSIPFLGFSQGSMDFENTTLTSEYEDGTFDDNGITYTYGHSRDQDIYNITNNGLMLRRASDSYLEWTISNGIGELNFQYKKAFTGSSVRQLEVYVNDVVVATTPTFGDVATDNDLIYDFNYNIDLSGEVVIKIKNVGTTTGNRQTVIDNIVWTAHEGGSTEPEMGETTIQVGSGSGSSSYFPNYYYYGYSYTQTIYTADELHAAGAHANGGEISMIKYLPKASVSTEKWRNFAIYMMNTSKVGFDNNTDWVDFASLTPVFDGDLIDNTVANQWMEITLDNPFDWNGSDNILVAVVDKTPGYGGSPNWAGYTLAPSAGSKGIYKYRDGDPIDLIDPASGTGTANVSNTIAQIQFFGTLQEVCTGTPTVGTVAQPLEICKNQPFTLSLDGTTEGLLGITYQWQESADGTTWTDMIGANTASYTVTDGVTEEGFYRLIITCTNSSQTVISNAIETTIKPGVDCYCTPEGTNENRFINNFSTTQGIQNVSNLNSGFSTEGYGDFTAMIIEQVQGASVDFSATINGGTAGFKIWIDWNQDGNFAPSESVFNTSSFVSSTTGTITVPLDALPGTTRMRIVSNWSVNTGGENPCATNYALGEFEDYTFEVTELADCTGTPDAGTVADIETCEMVPFTLSTDGVSTGAAGLTYQWEESTDGITWTDLVGANTASYTVTDGVTEEGFYRLVVTCVNSTETATSDAIATTLKVASECYCIPSATNANRYINDFTTTGGTQNITNTGTGFSTEGYGDFTAMIVEQVQSGTIDFTGNISGGSAGFKIWVDWNQDGTFESTEVAYQSSGYSTSPGGSFTVPLDALPGTTRMRIVSNWNVNTGGENPCETGFTYGEFEDYTFEVIELTACAGTPEAGTVTDIETCGMEPFTLSTDGASSGQSGLTYQWEESADGSTWTELVGANTASYTVSAGISTETSYRLVVTCENTSESVTSDALVVSLKAASECYCETSYGSGIEPITLVEVKDGTTTLFSNSSPTTSSVAHEDFRSISADVAREAEYDITVKGNTNGSYTSKITIYIDWNQDGNFNETTEKYTFPDIYNSTGEDAIVSAGTITVPTDALLGETRMRVTKRFSSVATPCNTAGYGQTEDYTLVIEEAAPITCDAPVDFTVNYDEVSETASVVIDGDVAYTYEVVYGETGFNPTADGTTIVTDLGNLTATIENLTDGSYDVYVRTICDLEDMSVFVGPENFIVGEVVVPDDCEWSVHVWGEEYMDEVYWELRDANNNILLSRAANYYDYNEDETLTVTAEGPLSFTIGADGFFSDNVANFTISNEAGIIAFGAVDGNVVTVTDLNCSDEALEPCTGTPDAGIVSINPESGVSGTDVTFESIGYSEGLGITYIIEYRFNNGVWQELPVNTPTLELTPTGDVGDVIEIRLIVTCTESGLSSISNTVIYTIVDEAVDCTTFIASVDGDAEICEGDETTLTVTATGVIASVEWDNGATGTELVVTEAGTYNGTVTSVDGCVEEISFEVTVNPLPTVDAIDVTDNGSGSYTFAAVDATNTVDYAWDFGNGSTSTDENPTFVYTVNGTYTVTLTVTNACGSTDVTTEVIFTGGIDCSTFTASIDGDAEICEGDETTLTVTATEAIASVEWSNGATGTDLLVTEAGTYEATVTSEDGCVEEVSFEVTVNPLPTVAGIAITENGEGSYTFAATDATDVTDYAWTFGDGAASSTDENPTYVYTEEGTYEVTLTVTNDCGTETVTETVVYSETGLDKNELIALNLFPNPSKEYVNVVYDGSYSIETIMVISPIGQKVFEVKVNGNNYQLDVTKYATGLYHMNIILSNGKMISRNFDVMK